jgi:hypothetical protein
LRIATGVCASPPAFAHRHRRLRIATGVCASPPAFVHRQGRSRIAMSVRHLERSRTTRSVRVRLPVLLPGKSPHQCGERTTRAERTVMKQWMGRQMQA